MRCLPSAGSEVASGELPPSSHTRCSSCPRAVRPPCSRSNSPSGGNRKRGLDDNGQAEEQPRHKRIKAEEAHWEAWA